MASKFITIDEVVASAAAIAKGATDQERHLMRQWVYDGNAEVGFSKLNMKVSKQLELDDYSTAKPLDHVRTLELALYDSNDREMMTRFKGYGKNEDFDVGVARTHEDVREVISIINITEDNDFFHTEQFDNETPEDAYIITKYLAVPVDDNGWPLIPASSKLSVMLYVKWMLALREDKDSRIEEKQWRVAKAAAYGKLQTPDIYEAREIAMKIHSMIDKPVLRDRQF
ncbi:hypothetical protein LCGC14_0667780 [marine sediment metagenome]|uniref:Uncharacterized protein n=1 Tax=marine sediment metagenome TaxID=412755 RepID=A0A0F9QWX2_9ZZZZ